MFELGLEHKLVIVIASALLVFHVKRLILDFQDRQQQLKKSAWLLRFYEARLLALCAEDTAEMRRLVKQQLRKSPGLEYHQATMLAYVELMKATASVLPSTEADASIHIDFNPVLTEQESRQWQRAIGNSHANKIHPRRHYRLIGQGSGI